MRARRLHHALLAAADDGDPAAASACAIAARPASARQSPRADRSRRPACDAAALRCCASCASASHAASDHSSMTSLPYKAFPNARTQVQIAVSTIDSTAACEKSVCPSDSFRYISSGRMLICVPASASAVPVPSAIAVTRHHADATDGHSSRHATSSHARHGRAPSVSAASSGRRSRFASAGRSSARPAGSGNTHTRPPAPAS